MRAIKENRMNIEIAPKEYWTRLPYDEAVFYCFTLGYRLPTEKEFLELSVAEFRFEGPYWTSEPPRLEFRYVYINLQKGRGGCTSSRVSSKCLVLPIRTKQPIFKTPNLFKRILNRLCASK